MRPLGLEIEYTNMKGKSDHIYLTFNQPSERQKLYHKIIVARQKESSLKVQDTEKEHPLSPRNTGTPSGEIAWKIWEGK